MHTIKSCKFNYLDAEDSLDILLSGYIPFLSTVILCLLMWKYDPCWFPHYFEIEILALAKHLVSGSKCRFSVVDTECLEFTSSRTYSLARLLHITGISNTYCFIWDECWGWLWFDKANWTMHPGSTSSLLFQHGDFKISRWNNNPWFTSSTIWSGNPGLFRTFSWLDVTA